MSTPARRPAGAATAGDATPLPPPDLRLEDDGCRGDHDHIGRTLAERMPTPAESQRLADTFQMLADAGRLRMVVALLEVAELCVHDIAAAAGMSQTACSHHLRLLRTGRLVRRRRSGRNILYSLDDAHVRLLVEVALEHEAHRPALDSAPLR